MLLSFSKNKWLHYLWIPGKGRIVLLLFLNVVIAATLGYLTPKLIAQFYQVLNDDKAFSEHLWPLIGLFIFEYFNRLSFMVATNRYVQYLINQNRRKSYSYWLKSSLTSKREKDYPLGEILARVMSDTDAIREIVTSGSFAIFIDIIFIFSCLISFLQLNSISGLSLFIVEIISCFLLIKGSRAMRKIFMEVRKITGNMARVVTDLTSGLKELFFSPHSHYAIKRGDVIFEKFLRTQLKANIWDASYYSAAESLYPILVASLMIVMPHSQITEVAILAALIDLIQKSIGPIKDVASKMAVISRAQTGIERIHQFNQNFISDDSFLIDESQKNPSSEFFNEIGFKELDVERFHFFLKSFQYESGFSLKDIEFNLNQGDILGIVGESGCGKSTLLKLISGQYQPFEGELRLDEKKLLPHSQSDLKTFSSFVSLISQDSHVFTESLKFNIGLGVLTGIEEFWDKALEAIPYLKRWNYQLEDSISPSVLSVGQKQLVSGLRALFLKKPIILMDEISSGLDSELELALRGLVQLFQFQSITIIVTHRLETILSASQILLIEEGQCCALGKPEDMKKNDYYKKFVRHLDFNH